MTEMTEAQAERIASALERIAAALELGAPPAAPGEPAHLFPPGALCGVPMRGTAGEHGIFRRWHAAIYTPGVDLVPACGAKGHGPVSMGEARLAVDLVPFDRCDSPGCKKKFSDGGA